MLRTVRLSQYYGRAFRAAVRAHGWRFAMQRAVGFIRRRVHGRVSRRLRPDKPAELISPFHEIIDTLGTTQTARPLLLIVSNIQIRQCIHYRIQQKLRYLEEIGLQAMHLQPTETGRLRAFLGLAHSVIVYRTTLPAELMQEFRDAGVRLIFEFDDLVVGPDALENSGILSQVTDTQAAHLLTLSKDLLNTALACDAIIVSTPYLAELYARPENGLSGKASFVIPNFVETDAYTLPGKKDVTFAFTSPSGSIRRELAMLTGFLTSYDANAEQDWSILVIGNDLVGKRLAESSFRRGQVIMQPFSAFEDYLQSIIRAETVLIPLSDNDFNRAKTPIRLLDAAISGTQAVFCPVGAYQNIQRALQKDSLCIASGAWAEAGAKIGPILAQLDANVADLQQAVRRVYGTEAAKSCYRQVFINDLGMVGAEHLAAA